MYNSFTFNSVCFNDLQKIIKTASIPIFIDAIDETPVLFIDKSIIYVTADSV